MPEYNWESTAVNEWSVKLDLNIAINHLVFSAETMKWFSAEGLALLENPLSLSYKTWQELLTKSFYLFRDFHKTKSVALLFVVVVNRGIADLNAFVTAHNCARGTKNRKEAMAWFQEIAYQLQPGARLGLNGEVDASLFDARDVILQLVPIAQKLQSGSLLEQLANHSYSGDALGQQFFIAHFKNWA